MATREEIREGIAKRHCDSCLRDEQCNFKRVENRCPEYYESADAELAYLDSQGVVLKVERELPELLDEMIQHDISLYWDKGLVSGDRQSLRGLLSLVEQQLTVEFCDVGYVAVAPLIAVKEETAEPEPEQSPKCPACEGRGFTEQEHGLLQIECEVCNGTGEIVAEDEETLLFPRTEFPSKESDSAIELQTEAPQTQRSPNLGEYFCPKCKSIHRETSKVGKRHFKYKIEPYLPEGGIPTAVFKAPEEIKPNDSSR